MRNRHPDLLTSLHACQAVLLLSHHLDLVVNRHRAQAQNPQVSRTAVRAINPQRNLVGVQPQRHPRHHRVNRAVSLPIDRPRSLLEDPHRCLV